MKILKRMGTILVPAAAKAEPQRTKYRRRFGTVRTRRAHALDAYSAHARAGPAPRSASTCGAQSRRSTARHSTWWVMGKESNARSPVSS
ncbi:hypothetical protein GCM10023224_48570 [Streptomonospora halophila]|uniref:Uncharacterized protein n=1 Tax=Streptomonospora halophila TaxID=427369 RepID=A0ABP9GYR5_9ACTN